MSYRLIASDMDGTLLTTDKAITPAVQSAVRRACEAGAVFCLASGRPLCGLKKYIDQLSLTSPVIACNGAVIVRPDGEVLWRRCLEPEAAREVISFAKRFDITLCVWSEEKLYLNRENERTDHYKAHMWIEHADVVTDWEPVIEQGIDKILWHDEADRVLGFQEILRREMKTQVNFFTSNPRFLEFIDHRASKAEALRRLAEIYGFDISETIAIGDGFNDLEMLRAAGLGVAMENAHEEIKAQCGWVAPSNENDGVAAVLERFVLCDKTTLQ